MKTRQVTLGRMLPAAIPESKYTASSHWPALEQALVEFRVQGLGALRLFFAEVPQSPLNNKGTSSLRERSCP